MLWGNTFMSEQVLVDRNESLPSCRGSLIGNAWAYEVWTTCLVLLLLSFSFLGTTLTCFGSLKERDLTILSRMDLNGLDLCPKTIRVGCLVTLLGIFDAVVVVVVGLWSDSFEDDTKCISSLGLSIIMSSLHSRTLGSNVGGEYSVMRIERDVDPLPRSSLESIVGFLDIAQWLNSTIEGPFLIILLERIDQYQ